MNEKLHYLKNQIENRRFQEVFDYLDLYFKEKPFYRYANLKQEILYQMDAGYPPKPMQVQALQMFLNDDKVKEAITFIEKNHTTTTTQKTATPMPYGTEKEIEGLKEVVKLLTEKKNFFLTQKVIAYDAGQKFTLIKQLEEIEKDLNSAKVKIEKYESHNANKLLNKVLDMVKEIKEENKNLQREINEIRNYSNKKNKSSTKKIKIFLASSSELKEDRRELREFISVENDRMIDKGVYFKLIQWEHFLDTISTTRLQDEYNKALQDCDLVVGLFFTKAGKFTEEELEKAYQSFKATEKPKILTYFKDAPVNMNDITEEVLSLLKMKKNLADKGHFYTSYPSIDWLKNHLKSQLEKLGYYD
ncbi:hypothetical protein [Bernardetia sp.]|uniref:hypothetical protein n=1 Tax=Bernardetia sp. TaxID=1937974 RepID=UPI0025C70714|nr:hypothetical protein [Bernardetia sp.]